MNNRTKKVDEENEGVCSGPSYEIQLCNTNDCPGI